jgi:hypothetical protein
MLMTTISRRQLVTGGAIMAAAVSASSPSLSAPADDQFDFSQPLQGWETISGDWAVQRVAGASRNGVALVQGATDNEYNVILAPGGPYNDVQVSVRFRPISGREDASGGIVFRFSEGRYYLVRANGLEDNFRLYYFDRGRRMLTTTTVKAPPLEQWHQLQITAKGDRIQGWLNQQALIDERDTRFAAGRIGLWTKADSITAFDELTVVPLGG